MISRAIAVVGLAVLGAANASAQLSAPRWNLTRELVIDGNAAELDIVTGITVGPDGAVYVLQPRQNLFRVFENDGRFRGLVGRPGAGPGELRSLAAFGWIDDTLWVLDRMQRRTVLFDSKGRHIRTTPTPGFSNTEEVTPEAVLTGGRMLTSAEPIQPRCGTAANERTRRLAIQPESGSVSKSLIEFRALPDYIEMRPCAYVGNFFADSPIVSVCPGGARFYVVESRAPASESAVYSIRRFSADGTPLGSVVAGKMKARPMPPGFVDSVQRSFVSADIRAGTISESEYLAQVHRAIPQRLFRRAFDHAMCAREGDLWLHLAGGPTWVLLGASNTFERSVDLPPNAELGYATRDKLWLLQRDELDVQSIVRYTLERLKRP